MFKYITSIVLITLVLTTSHVTASENKYEQLLGNQNKFELIKDKPEIIVFKRKGCGNCKKEESFLKNNELAKNNFQVQFLDINDKQNKEQWQKVVEKHKLSKVTPITLVGGDILVGFNERVLKDKLENNKNNHQKYGLDFYLGNGQADSSAEEYSCKVESASSCSLEQANDSQEKGNNAIKSQQTILENNTLMTLPVFGEIDAKKTSLVIMSSVLGFVDGFNPCAMWVLITFLVILSQVGSKRKMIYLAGLFIVAEGVMYFLILNIWYQTWDFIQLDQWVTPMVGTIAIAGGMYFLYKYHKNKDSHLACEVTSLKHQQKTVAKIKEVVSKPITIITTLAVLGIAFSVNIIEFACSVGIAQSFTKILELNELNFFLRQWYIFIYSLFYMADDFLIFGLAIFGYQKFTTIGAKYSHLSGLLGGILMIVLGLLLIFKPDLLAL